MIYETPCLHYSKARDDYLKLFRKLHITLLQVVKKAKSTYEASTQSYYKLLHLKKEKTKMKPVRHQGLSKPLTGAVRHTKHTLHHIAEAE